MARAARHARTGTAGRWKGWDRQPRHAPVVVRQEATREPAPMTERQAAYLRDLCTKAGVAFNPKWTKAQASKRIGQLKAGAGDTVR